MLSVVLAMCRLRLAELLLWVDEPSDQTDVLTVQRVQPPERTLNPPPQTVTGSEVIRLMRDQTIGYFQFQTRAHGVVFSGRPLSRKTSRFTDLFY